MTSHPLVFTTELSSTGIQESDINVPAMQYMVSSMFYVTNFFLDVLNIGIGIGITDIRKHAHH